MFGALLTRVPNPYSLMSAFHIIYTGWIILSAGSGIFGILAGLALFAGMGAAAFWLWWRRFYPCRFFRWERRWEHTLWSFFCAGIEALTPLQAALNLVSTG